MEFNVRSLNSEDYKILVEWWKEWKWPILPKEALPSNGTGGIMVYKKDILVVAGFLYWSNSKMVWLDWIISNPKYKENDRKEVLEKAVKTIKHLNSKKKFKKLFKALPETYLAKSGTYKGQRLETGNTILETICGFCQFRKHCWPKAQLHEKVTSRAKSKPLVWYNKLKNTEVRYI